MRCMSSYMYLTFDRKNEKILAKRKRLIYAQHNNHVSVPFLDLPELECTDMQKSMLHKLVGIKHIVL